MKVLVTGGTGSVGRLTVARLVRHGHQVRVIGRRTGMVIEGAEYRSCDITDFASLREQVKGMDAIVHLAAIPNPLRDPGQEVFRVNCLGSFNVYRAAADEGIRRVVSASSINALGFNYGIKAFHIQYFPIDEDHPSFTTDSYSFSKQVLEEIAAYFWRREGISGVCLRLPAVCEPGARAERWYNNGLPRFREAFARLMELPEEERREKVNRLIAHFDAARSSGDRWMAFWHEPDSILLAGGFGRSNFWTAIHAEDSAQAFEKGLLADYEGAHPLYVNDSYNAVGVETETLLRLFFPDTQARKRPLRGIESAVSIDRARELIGFEPEFHFAKE